MPHIKKTNIFVFFILFSFLALLTLFFPLKFLFLAYISFIWTFFLILLGSNSYFLQIADCFKSFLISKIALDIYPVVFITRLQSHYLILVFSLAKYLKKIKIIKLKIYEYY